MTLCIIASGGIPMPACHLSISDSGGVSFGVDRGAMAVAFSFPLLRGASRLFGGPCDAPWPSCPAMTSGPCQALYKQQTRRLCFRNSLPTQPSIPLQSSSSLNQPQSNSISPPTNFLDSSRQPHPRMDAAKNVADSVSTSATNAANYVSDK